MNILVFDVPAESGGAKSILEDVYKTAKNHPDKSIKWVFIVSKPELEEVQNIRVLRFPWIKKSWLHRLFFDTMLAPYIVKKYAADKVFSLQNLIIPFTNRQQILYLHQPLPFVDYRFKFKENKLFWIYQNIMSKLIYSSIRNADKIIVQTQWIKEACKEKLKINANKIMVIPPEVSIEVENVYLFSEKTKNKFFYPASALQYKNHKVIVEACKMLKEEIEDFEVIFTLKGEENSNIIELGKECKKHNLPIKFIGNLSREEVFEMYTKSNLIFPSYIETFGLPMLEARLHKSIIFASDCAFSKEILGSYENAYFFDPFNSKQLFTLMRNLLKDNIRYTEIKDKQFQYNKRDNLIEVVCEQNNSNRIEKK